MLLQANQRGPSRLKGLYNYTFVIKIAVLNFIWKVLLVEHACVTFLLISCRACVVFNDRLYTFGGQEGDFMAKPGSPIFKCSRRNEVGQFLTW